MTALADLRALAERELRDNLPCHVRVAPQTVLALVAVAEAALAMGAGNRAAPPNGPVVSRDHWNRLSAALAGLGITAEEAPR